MREECIAAVEKICSFIVNLAVGAEERSVDFLLRAWSATSGVRRCEEELIVDFQTNLNWEVKKAGLVGFLLLDSSGHSDCRYQNIVM